MKNLILDLDQTLISAERYRRDYLDAPTPKGTKRFVIPGTYVLVTRPHLKEFLDFAFANFAVSVWTAASKSYGLWILGHVFPREHRRKIRYFFFSYHTRASERVRAGHKDLSLLWTNYKLKEFSRENTFIVDDNEEVCAANGSQCIDIAPWYFTQPEKNSRIFSEIRTREKRFREKIFANSHAGEAGENVFARKILPKI
jgi:TFIIF-interacting CTD phosphatase-like protein